MDRQRRFVLYTLFFLGAVALGLLIATAVSWLGTHVSSSALVLPLWWVLKAGITG